MLNKMNIGIELISQERDKQIEKFGFTGDFQAMHPKFYADGQLIEAATILLECEDGIYTKPLNWDEEWFHKLMQHSKTERLVIAGALIAAELDRLESLKLL